MKSHITCELIVRRRYQVILSSLVVGLFTGLTATHSIAQNRSSTAAQAFASFGHLGEWSVDCHAPPSPQNPHTFYEANPDGSVSFKQNYGNGLLETKIFAASIDAETLHFSYITSTNQVAHLSLRKVGPDKTQTNELWLESPGGSQWVTQQGIVIKTGAPLPPSEHCNGGASVSASAKSVGLPAVTITPDYEVTITACPGCSAQPTRQSTYTTLGFQVPSENVSGTISCRGVVQAGDGSEVIMIAPKQDDAHDQVYLNNASLIAMLNALKSGAYDACHKGQASGNLRVGPQPLPNRLVVQSIRDAMFDFMASADSVSAPWVIQKNGPLERAQQRQNQALAQQQAQQQQQQRVAAAQRGIEAARQEFAAHPQTAEDKSLVDPILALFRSKKYPIPLGSEPCTNDYEFIGGSVAGRSIDGLVGVFLINIMAVNKTDQAIGPNSLVAEVCGKPPGFLQPGGRLNLEIQAQFRKYDVGWRFEKLMQ